MNLLADESIDAPIVARLQAEGHHVEYVAEMAPGISDEAVLGLASSGGAVLMTADKDFGELVFRLRRAPGGVVLVRLAGLSASLKADLLADALRTHGHKMMKAFSVITAGMVRIRPGP
jgi:predicted nuclease of predicted toxin-antitoxin system